MRIHCGKLIFFFVMMMESLPGEILGEILKWLTPIQISIFGIVSKVMRGKILGALRFEKLEDYINQWRCDECSNVSKKMYKVNIGISYCNKNHKRDKACIACFKRASNYCGPCLYGTNRQCTRCHHRERKTKVSVCSHGWGKIICIGMPCRFICEHCNWISSAYNGNFTCGQCGKMRESLKDCLCEKTE
jgi:hypothetical protein